jgi:tetratricopeptide (TPR) repeat protein
VPVNIGPDPPTPVERAKKNLNHVPRIAGLLLICTAWVMSLCSCSAGYESEPLVEYSTDVVVTGSRMHGLTRQLDSGVYLVEIRERDIDIRATLDAGTERVLLGDVAPRHGLLRRVVRLEAPARLRITLDSSDVRGWKGAAAVRILRWPSVGTDGTDQRLLGFEALGTSAELLARGTPEAWHAALEPLREAARQFQAGHDLQSLAEAEYLRGWLELAMLFDFDAGRRSAELAVMHFRGAGDAIGTRRASVLLAEHEIALAAAMGPAARDAQRKLLEAATARLVDAQSFFEARDLQSDALHALDRAQQRARMLGRRENGALVYESMRRRARTRGDRYFEVIATQELAAIAQGKGDVVRAAALYEMVLPLIERERNPALYAALRANLGDALITLGEFDRALVLHTEALELFAARADDSRTARELSALASIQFRSGNVERALATIESALPLYARSRDQADHAAALRLAGNAAAELGRHDVALDYLHRAERLDWNGADTGRTRVLIAGELRTLGDFAGAGKLLEQVLLAADDSTRADALSERARLRQAQNRPLEAMADLREADAIYARLKLDFNRIDSSSALALALLDAGHLDEAGVAADTAIAMERRIRVKAGNPEMRARFLAASYAPYEARIEVDLARAPTDRMATWRAFRTAETVRARSLADRLAHGPGAPEGHDAEIERLRNALTSLQGELERRTRRDMDRHGLLELRRRVDEVQARLDVRLLGQRVEASDRFAMAGSRSVVQSALPPDTAVLAYFVGDRRSHAWLMTQTELRHGILPGRRVLQDFVSSFVAQQRGGALPAGGVSFPALLGDLLAGLQVKRLLILPDGPLNGLPFAALSMPRSSAGDLLVDHYEISAAPSLALAMRPAPRRPGAVTRVAVISDPVYTPDDRRLSAFASHASLFRGAEPGAERLARLPYSAIEARAVTRAFHDADIIELAGFNATVPRVLQLPSRDLDVLHFATHAQARRDAPEQSALFLSEYAADGSMLPTDRLTAEEIRRHGLRADVVVLSGCATGDGRELRGEGVLGLTYGFLSNGSDTVIASLWPVEDALAARFMQEFYASYRATGRASQALRVAQLRTRGIAGPSVWASFVVRSGSL